MKNKYKLILPNHIVIKDGLSCGDKVTLLYDFNKDIMKFQIISEGCRYCDSICELLQEKFNNKHVVYIQEQCQQIINLLNKFHDKVDEMIGLPYKLSREECYLAPIRILLECAKENNKYKTKCGDKVNLDIDKMECDACAIRDNVSWLYDKAKHEHGKYKISKMKRKLLMKLGRVVTNNLLIEEVKEVYNSLTDDDFEFMEEYKLLPMVYKNLKKLGILNKNDTRWRLLVYQRQRTVIAYKEVNQIKKFINEQNLQAFFVKGAYTYKFYNDKEMRNLTDFDILATKEEDAFILIEWLLQHDFCIFPDSFSLKKTKQKDDIVYTGHLHFQKIINIQYRMIIDVNFTGFPMMRVASYVPKILNNEIQLESMIVVSVCHLFKHKEVFMKDINDIYCMLLSGKVNFDILYRELEKNELLDLFEVICDYFIKEYALKDECKNLIMLFKKNYKNNDFCLLDWPYDEKAVEQVKLEQLKKYSKNYIDHNRLYLYPIFLFRNRKNVIELHEKIMKTTLFKVTLKEKLTDEIILYKIDEFYFVLCQAGLFLQMKEYYQDYMKESIRNIGSKILDIFNVECIDIPYALDFKEKWLDTKRE